MWKRQSRSRHTPPWPWWRAEKSEHLEYAPHGRTMIGHATGVVMGRYKVDSSPAFNLLVRISNEENRKVSAVAAQLVEQHDMDPSRNLRLLRLRLRLVRRMRAKPKS